MDPVNIVLIIIIAAILIFAVTRGIKKAKGGCCGGGNYKVRKVRAESANRLDYAYSFVIGVDGMTCNNCKTRVENAFNRKGYYAKVSLSKKRAVVLSKQELTRDMAEEIVSKDGYTVTEFECVKYEK